MYIQLNSEFTLFEFEILKSHFNHVSKLQNLGKLDALFCCSALAVRFHIVFQGMRQHFSDLCFTF